MHYNSSLNFTYKFQSDFHQGVLKLRLDTLYYTPQNKLRVTQCFSPYVDYWLCSLAQTRKDIEKRFLPLLRESEMKRFQSKIWHLKFSFSSFAKFAIFAKISKIHVLSFLLMSGLCVVNST